MSQAYRQYYEDRLVDRLCAGDPLALDALYEMHVDSAYGFARSMLGNPEDAEEAALEAFTRAFRKAGEFRGQSSFRTWLFTILRNACRDRQRQQKLPFLSFETDGDWNHPPVGGGVPSSLELDVRDALTRLSEDYREALIFCDVEEWSAREAAELMGRSHESMKSLLYRARRALRDILQEQWSEGRECP